MMGTLAEALAASVNMIRADESSSAATNDANDCRIAEWWLSDRCAAVYERGDHANFTAL